MSELKLQHPVPVFLLRRNPLTVASRTMRRGIRGFCHDVGSTSTQQLSGVDRDADAASSSFLTVPSSVVGSCAAESVAGGPQAAVTLEQMILQLDLEEEAAASRKARRMSCVDSSDHYVLRSARDALSHYPRFSLDGRDAMCRASFSSYHDAAMTLDGPVLRDDGRHRRASVCCAAAGVGHCRARGCGVEGYEMDLERTLRMPATVAGESVVWCKPGVVAKLMGLDSVPVPVGRGRRGGIGRRKASGAPPVARVVGGGGVKKQRPRRIVGKEEELEKDRLFMALHGYDVAGAGARPAGAPRAAVDPNVSGFRTADSSWEFRFPS
ncbi:uncharacterized protein [Lolium perenne]|uniref:uncharacterized protein n=1 Tax=Lolium perenne TaxID=4522 RepID=UPI0021EA591A|nr:uncharacterized protein LOC127342423 [Lolium perenne]XP_051224341.1 uncharacterized protein LOC127342423 [Lolium perenne]XP_051224342.1 uncharacterized protein LOC127342423 [Lolium perenne]XP_051224343.1 uncharacterized protein LOC127342423 [Lolium perenne]XP_051224344.1 uncharacterized protein LOC127342423 [Lolium perenne]